MAAASSETFDVAVVGGGLVGCSTAIALRARKLSVALIEASPLRSGQQTWDERCIGLNAASRKILEALDLWALLADQAEPILSTHISEKGRFGAARFTSEQAGLPALGYNTPLRAINEVLWTRAKSAGAQIFCPARVESLDILGQAASIKFLADGDTRRINAKLLVAADGARSAVRGLLGLSARQHDYQQRAIVTAIRPQFPHEGVAYERFLDSGPLAILPKPDDVSGRACSLIWTVPELQAQAMTSLNDKDFLTGAMEAFGERLGKFTALGARQHFPLHQVYCPEMTAARTVLIGNAAQSLHPVAAQGFNLGLRDAANLAEILENEQDPGAASVLDAYAAVRKQDRDQVAGFTDGLVRLFSNKVPGLRSLRHIGLMLLEFDSPARDRVLRQNLGMGTGSPGIAREVRP